MSCYPQKPSKEKLVSEVWEEGAGSAQGGGRPAALAQFPVGEAGRVRFAEGQEPGEVERS